MKTLERFLRAAFWLPILLAAFVAVAFIDPNLHRLRLISLGALGAFVCLALFQGLSERAALRHSRNVRKREAETKVALTSTTSG
jgi:hypothetical protein